MTMKKEKYPFDLNALIGNWESVNLNPTVIIYKNSDKYLLGIIHMDETTRQARPATYEIQADENGFYICYNLKRVSIGYNAILDILIFSSLGDYLWN
jgi:hypothetical protein